MGKKVVVDTSVMVSALLTKRGGAAREVVRRCLKDEYSLLISNALFREYEDVSTRKRILDLRQLSEKEIRELLNAFYSVCRWVPIYFLWRPNLQDENDNFLIELALAGNSEIIVTNNIQDLVNAELIFGELRILKPEQLLRGE
jgi:uncharacterized protein